MATKSFSGNMTSATSLNNSPSCSLSGGYGVITGIVNSVYASLTFSTNAYSNTYSVTATVYYNGGSFSTTQSVKMDSKNYTSGTFNFWFNAYLTAEQADSIYSVQCSCSTNGSKIFLKNAQSVTVDYTVPSNAGAPTSVSIASAVTGSSTTLSWSGASSGSSNYITGYIIQYADSSDGSYYGNWIDYTSVQSSYTYGSTSVSMPALGRYRKFRVQTIGSAGYSYYSGYTESGSTYHAYTPNAPANLTPTAGAYQTLSSISWDAVSCTDAIAHYQYQISTNNGSSWGSTTNATSTSVNFSSTFAALSTSARVKYRVCAVTNKGVSSSYATSGTFYRITAPTAPTTFTASPTSYESGNITIAWSGVTDEDANITDYAIQYATSENNASWSDWTDLKTVQSSAFSGSTTDAPDMPRGTYRKYRIRAHDTHDLYSAWEETTSVYRALSATVPGNIYPMDGWFETAPTLSWSASTAPDGNLAGYQYQISADGGTSWGTEYTTTALSAECEGFSSAARGTLFQFRVRAYTTTGATSDWAVSADFGKNTLPSKPTTLAPLSEKTVYGTGVWFILSCAAKSNGIAQVLQHKTGTGEWKTEKESTVGAFVAAVRVTTSGAHAFRLVDDVGAESATSSVSITITPQPFTDASIVSGTTRVKAVHVVELRIMINLYRAAYGLSTKVWHEGVLANTTSLRGFNDHIVELRAAVNETIQLLNTLSGQALIPVPSWCGLLPNAPSAAAITELRSNIRKL